MMKKVYLIQYNLENTKDFEERLKSLGRWYKYFSNNWIIESELTSKQIYDQISIGLEQQSIFIIQLENTNYWGRMNTALWDYLKESRRK